MRLAQEAQVMPVMASSTSWVGASVAMVLSLLVRRIGGGAVRLHREGGGAHGAAVLEVEEEPVRARRGEGGRELDARAGLALLGVDVEVAQVAGPDRHEVAEGPEVGLEVGDGLAVQ